MVEKHRIIIDTDTAGDDAAALIIAANAPDIEILGVTVQAGNVSLDQGAKNAWSAAMPRSISGLRCRFRARRRSASASSAPMVWGMQT